MMRTIHKTAIFGNSPFLTEGLLSDIEAVRALAMQGPDRTFAEILDGINDDLAAQPTAAVMAALRRAKRHAAHSIFQGSSTRYPAISSKRL